MADPDLPIRKGGSFRPLDKRGGEEEGRPQKNFFSALRVSFWSKNKGGGGPPPRYATANWGRKFKRELKTRVVREPATKGHNRFDGK